MWWVLVVLVRGKESQAKWSSMRRLQEWPWEGRFVRGAIRSFSHAHRSLWIAFIYIPLTDSRVNACVASSPAANHLPCALSIYLSIYLSICLLRLGRFFSVLFFYTVGRNNWTREQPVARSLPTRDNTNRINAYRYPCLEWDSNPRCQC
jgi:hypothetical protein